LTGVYLYKLDDRWRVSPNYENKKSWFFTDKGVKTLTKDTKFYHGDDSSYKIHKSKFRVATLENVRDTFYAYEGEKGVKLSVDQKENFLGAYNRMPGYPDVYVHGPINYDFDGKKLLTEDEADILGCVYITKNSFSDGFKRESCFGYYDRVTPRLFVRRERSTIDNQYVYLYKLDNRWVIGPHALAKDNRKCWAYSSVNDGRPTEPMSWYEVTDPTEPNPVKRNRTIRIIEAA